MFICETWNRSENDFILKATNHKCYVLPRKQQSRRGRPAGSVALLIAHKFVKFIKSIHMDQDDCIAIILDKQVLGLCKDVIMCFVYVPPEGSSYYNDKNEQNGVYMLEDYLLNLTAKYHDTHMLVAGDLKFKDRQYTRLHNK